MMSITQQDVPSLELLVQCQLELDRIRRELAGADAGAVHSRLDRVERAMSWLASGHYGFCGVCGRRIPDATLRAAPERLTCDRCARPRRAEPVADAMQPW
jgi:RNA polymerase-binding transcription factor DksA